MITSYTLFLEKTFGDVSIFDDEINFDTKYIKDVFDDDVELLPKVYLEKYDKELFLKYYDTKFHNIKEKIETRTPVNSISEFNEIFKQSLIDLFNKHFNALSKRMSQFKMNRIAVKVPDLMAYIIIEYDVDMLYQDYTTIRLVTILPTISSPSKINRIFYL